MAFVVKVCPPLGKWRTGPGFVQAWAAWSTEIAQRCPSLGRADDRRALALDLRQVEPVDLREDLGLLLCINMSVSLGRVGHSAQQIAVVLFTDEELQRI